MLVDRIEKDLAKLRKESQYRKIPCGRVLPEFDFSSNDYLGLSGKLLSNFSEWNIKRVGTAASRLLAHNCVYHAQLEDEISHVTGSKDALLFSSGYLANVGVLSGLVKRGDFVIADKLIHASLIDGIRLSNAKLSRARHNDLTHFERFLKEISKNRKQRQEIFIVVETVYSMDGDCAPIDGLVLLANKYNATLVLDDSHAFGVHGEGGVGLGSFWIKKYPENIIVLGTFSKACGSYGGFVCCSELVKNILVNSSRSFIYNTALPDFCCAASLQAINYLKNNLEAGSGVLKMAEYFRSNLGRIGIQSLSTSQIVPIIIGNF